MPLLSLMHMIQNYIQQLTQAEPIFQNIIVRYGMPKITTRKAGFGALVHLILEQQVSIASAKSCYIKIENHSPIIPKNLLLISNEQFKTLGVSKQKTLYIKNLAQQIVDNTIDIENLHTLPNEEIFKKLTSLKGIGSWTAQVYMMFCLQNPDIFPVGDIAVQKTMQELFGCTTIQQMEEKANQWKPYRSYATYILWHHYLSIRNRIV